MRILLHIFPFCAGLRRSLAGDSMWVSQGAFKLMSLLRELGLPVWRRATVPGSFEDMIPSWAQSWESWSEAFIKSYIHVIRLVYFISAVDFNTRNSICDPFWTLKSCFMYFQIQCSIEILTEIRNMEPHDHFKRFVMTICIKICVQTCLKCCTAIK